jgi:hemolysin III
MEAQQVREELANTITHASALVLSALGGGVLLTLAAVRGGAWEFAGVSIFVATLLLLYAASTCYHGVRSPHLKRRLQVLDHCAIYLLIAGTFTPFALGPMRGPLAWALLVAMWGMAAAGIVFKLFLTGRWPRLSTATYIGMGWIGGIAALPMARHLSTASLTLLLTGGIIYTAGTAFYHARRLPYAHSLWHMFVLAGSACHVVAVGLLL